MFNCMTFHNHRVAQFEIMPHLQQMYALFHAQNCFDMGFTTLRDLGMNGPRGLLVDEMCAVRDAINAGIVEGPRMLIGAFTTMTGSHLDLIQPRAMYAVRLQYGRRPVGTAQTRAQEPSCAGCDVIKTCASGGGGTDKEEPDIRNMTQEELDAIVDEAHALHKIAAVHCFTTRHNTWRSKRAPTRSSTWFFGRRDDRHDLRSGRAGDADACRTAPITRFSCGANIGTAEFVLNKIKYLQPFCFETFQKMHKAGIKIAMGTDMGFEPRYGHERAELEIYVKLGMTRWTRS